MKKKELEKCAGLLVECAEKFKEFRAKFYEFSDVIINQRDSGILYKEQYDELFEIFSNGEDDIAGTGSAISKMFGKIKEFKLSDEIFKV